VRTSRARSAGFTLLELLVVILIIGILATFATLSIGNRALDDRLEVESQRLEQILKLASEEAETKGIEIGFRYIDAQYEFLAIGKEGHWAPYTASGPLRPRALPQPFYLEVQVEGRQAKDVVTKPDDKDKIIEPQILLLSSGEVTAFTIDVHADNYAPYYRLKADTLGKITRERHDDNR
jgi:general secretion pathway protein H